ncbi:leukocyte surface antigen CD47 isoform X3 [Carettochelys insculpta]|uniref:leukocyte surface antigen CD47 isoform X3 n=1 Tax=Carettochelys insculpta TaxID=44489 RepID=UPI003EBD579B
MWALGAWLLLGALGTGFAQLKFNATKSLKQSSCNETVILPCIVTNLAMKNIQVMFVKWKLEKREFFSFEGLLNKTHVNKSFSTAHLASVSQLPQGVASLSISKHQAVSGNYSCEVTESNREGETEIELTYYQDKTCNSDVRNNKSWFTPLENTLIILFLSLAILFYWLKFGIAVSKFETTTQKKVGLIIGGVVITLFAFIGFILLVPGGFGPKNQAGLALIVLPAVILVPLLFFVLRIVYENELRKCAIVLIVLQSVGYLIAVIGFGLCIAACPPKMGAVLIVGLGVLALVGVVGLIYVIMIGSSKKDHQPSRKPVEEPLNV